MRSCWEKVWEALVKLHSCSSEEQRCMGQGRAAQKGKGCIAWGSSCLLWAYQGSNAAEAYIHAKALPRLAVQQLRGNFIWRQHDPDEKHWGKVKQHQQWSSTREAASFKKVVEVCPKPETARTTGFYVVVVMMIQEMYEKQGFLVTTFIGATV